MSSQSNSFVCSECSVTFTVKRSLRRHLKKIHSYEVTDLRYKHICPVCAQKFQKTEELHSHISSDHDGINLVFEDRTFYTDDEFIAWKSKIEKETSSSFIKHWSSWKKADGSIVTKYFCHRSGPSRPPKGAGKRCPKISGSVKIGCTCPAIMNVTKQTLEEATEIVVRFQSVYVGHNTEPEKLKLNSADRAYLASLMEQRIPDSVILGTVKKFSTSERLALTTRKDLHNIRRDFSIDRSILHQNDAVSVDLLVEENKEDNTVLLCDRVGQSELIFDISEEPSRQQEEKEIIIQELERENQKAVSTIKSEIQDYLNEIKNLVSSTESEDVLKYIEKNLQKAKSELYAASSAGASQY